MIKEAIEHLAGIIGAGQRVITAADREFFAVPEGYEVKALEPRHAAPAPYIIASTRFNAPESLAEYVKRFPSSSALAFADTRSRQVKVVLDYHEDEKPTVETHTALWQQSASRELKAWRIGEWLSHQDFVELLESRPEAEITEPSMAEVMSLIETLELVEKNSLVSRQSRDGSRSGFVVQKETMISGTAAKETVTTVDPLRELSIYIPIVDGFGVEAVPVPLKVQWRATNGISVRLTCPTLETALDAIFIKGLATLRASGITVLDGSR